MYMQYVEPTLQGEKNSFLTDVTLAQRAVNKLCLFEKKRTNPGSSPNL